ncbi:NADPH-dependent FMN reductase [Pseudoxanthomonas taiwanensis]|jgi:Predicted flavoprotein|uniref:NADPH-dependent FMN reductase n=1 Tax=Pseudoxanthomonas taiwanensis TaxID=176598 RepID=A0A921P116_9GAMM|nr:NADPH-dependent FMN reductase [Pseudoxanthomonas taiwanensis]KAF1689131.1 NADPH-dependent FMN reductase [Pseudoxanthomonas taiwanensis]MBO2468804.1 NADPH-dependent FMN reductase [Xanthomonadaceae bacterium]
MDKRTIAVFVGSLRKDSYNRQLARALERLAEDRLRFDYVDIGRLPFYNQDLDGDYPPGGVALKRQVRGADAVLFVTPEYNRSVPGVLKNAIDLASRPYGDSAFAGLPAAVIGASPGAIGTALAQQHLRNILSYLDMAVMPQPEAYIQFEDGLVDADGRVTRQDTREFLEDFVDRFVNWISLQRG